MLKFGSAKAKFTANAIFLQTLAEPAAQAAKADVLKVARQAAAVGVTKEAANAAVNAEAATGDKVVVVPVAIAEVRVDQALAAHAEPVVVAQAAVALTVQAVQVAAVAVRVEIVQAVRERDNN